MTLQLVRSQRLTGNVWSFIFSPSQRLTWIAGQFIRVGISHDNPDEEGTKRWFTISSTPNERLVQISTRITDSSFKQALSRLPIGGRLTLLDQPEGDFIWRNSNEKLIFVAQGIGITPFLSMLRDRTQKELPLSAILFYSNRQGDAPPFQAELANMVRKHTEFTVNQAAEPFTASQLAKLAPRISSSLVYVSGPVSLIELLKPPYNLTSRQLKSDFFPGYSATDY